MLYSAIAWRAASYMHDISLDMIDYEKQHWSTQSLLFWAIAFCKQEYDFIVEFTKQGKQQISVQQWPPYGQKKYDGLVIFGQKENMIEIKAEIYQSSKRIHYLSAHLERTKENETYHFYLRNWQSKQLH
jgi:hypothetical protein